MWAKCSWSAITEGQGHTDHVHILDLNGESCRLKQSKARRRRAAQTADDEAAAVDPETGEITP
jgi:hypothetical protein